MKEVKRKRREIFYTVFAMRSPRNPLLGSSVQLCWFTIIVSRKKTLESNFLAGTHDSNIALKPPLSE